jgi:hypothetical protein
MASEILQRGKDNRDQAQEIVLSMKALMRLVGVWLVQFLLLKMIVMALLSGLLRFRQKIVPQTKDDGLPTQVNK